MEDKIKNLYKLLDLEPGASIENVKRAFRELSHIWHPDNHFKKSEGVQARAEEKFKEISQAYQELKEHLGKEETRKRKEEEARQEREKESRRAEEQKKREQEERARKEREQREREERDRKIRKEREENIRKKTEQSKREHQEKERKFWEEEAKRKHEQYSSDTKENADSIFDSDFKGSKVVEPVSDKDYNRTFDQMFNIKVILALFILILFAKKQNSLTEGLISPINVPSQEVAQNLSELPENATREQSQVYPNTRDLQKGGAAFATGDFQKAIALFIPLAKEGNPLAQGSLGMMHYMGYGVPQNFKEAIKWYRKAAEQGYPLALFDLGVMYDKGHGVPQDNQMAIKWWTKAAEQNHLGAQYNLGLKYAKLMSVPDDLFTAYKWANMAAANGHKEATRLLNTLRKNMTPAQIAEAQRLSEELVKKARTMEW